MQKGFHRFLTISKKCTFIFHALSGNVHFFNVYVYFSLHDQKKFAWIFHDFLWIFINFQFIFMEIPWFLMDFHGFSQIFNNFHWICKGFHRFLTISSKCTFIFYALSGNVFFLMIMYTFHYMTKKSLHGFSMISYEFSSIFYAFSWKSNNSW